jgi:hypothetical protein
MKRGGMAVRRVGGPADQVRTMVNRSASWRAMNRSGTWRAETPALRKQGIFASFVAKYERVSQMLTKLSKTLE